MDNAKLPAYPQSIAVTESGDTYYSVGPDSGFSKLELASLMIAQGYIANGAYKDDEQEGEEIARCSINLARLILKKTNK